MDLTHRIRTSFDNQSMLATIGATLDFVSKGEVHIGAALAPHLLQQQGFAHGGLVFSLGDVAAGYAALSVQPDGAEVVTAELKINYLSPGTAPRLQARGRVLKPGRRLTVVASDVFGIAEDGSEKHIATLLGTMAVVPGERP
ncbi:PaaI family thioesterase [Pseudoprimorskyibacter insulae]|uniref:Thioesterase domain-containing protein n=1 Tax=Pseudoprimorskyibacter insulae TaxID=1695997 RepID=A0A2R8AVG3_9RHOB|nr:PaaI family thioesterase [Pseudoprimorskyibacter insulae]SPF79990.1 hypothetical protein PRI8871_01792 [Pseudoprimorskyibacter insulae]